MRAAIAFLVLVTVGVFAIWFKGCLAVDRCLDSGGRYDHESGRCEYTPASEGSVTE